MRRLLARSGFGPLLLALLLLSGAAPAPGETANPYERRSLARFQAEAEAGDPEAQYTLGRMLELGTVGAPDPQAAARWYRQAAEAGHGEAEFRLAHLLQSGLLGAPQQAEAAHWYESAAKAGIAEAAYNLAVMYEAGIGVPPDREEARSLYLQAFRGGLTKAAVNLALLSLSETPADPVAAYGWLLRAEAVDSEVARELRRDVGLLLDEGERRRARKLAEQPLPP